jgi:hypothetical protein
MIFPLDKGLVKNENKRRNIMDPFFYKEGVQPPRNTEVSLAKATPQLFL